MELIERSEFLELMGQQYNKVLTGEGQTLFITGEAGIGKTSLAKKFIKQVEHKSRLYTTACDSLFSPPPLAPIYDLAWQIQEDLIEHPEKDKIQFFNKVLQALNKSTLPIVLLIEDIHWADEATLDFIKFFARRITRFRCLFMLSFRDNEITQNHPLRNVLGDLSAETFTKLSLTPLSKEAVLLLSEEKGLDGNEVYHISEGIPFYVTEIINNEKQDVPDNIKDAVLSVYHRQPQETKELLTLLSVIPDRFEIKLLQHLEPSFLAAVDECIAQGILVTDGQNMRFKHELYRRTIEQSLSPFKRIALNKKMLECHLDEKGERRAIEKIVHFAKYANAYDAVAEYAPIAAKEAAALGAHREASKLYLTAIEYAQNLDEQQLVQLYEKYAYECYLTNQIREAIIYQGKALKIWQKVQDKEKTGNSLRFLSRLWWFEGKREEAESFAFQAIDVLRDQPPSKEKAMAFSNLSQLKMLADQEKESISWGNEAIEMAKCIRDDEILCHALNNVGTVFLRTADTRKKGMEMLNESLSIALENSYHEHAARAYCNIGYVTMTAKQHGTAIKAFTDGYQYCDERDLDSWSKYMQSCKGQLFMELGEWQKAEALAEDLLKNDAYSPIIKIVAVYILGKIKMRRGESDAAEWLEKGWAIALPTREVQRIAPALSALFEMEWLRGKPIVSDEDLHFSIDLITKTTNDWQNAEYIYWLYKARGIALPIHDDTNPYRILLEGQYKKAAAIWSEKGCRYEEAIALFEGGEEEKRKALSLLMDLGATATYKKLKQQMQETGMRRIPRGLRDSTKNNPAQLTNRQVDILKLLKQGLQNKEIAQELYIAPKTVDHHISAILFKLDVNSRNKAVSEATRLGILK